MPFFVATSQRFSTILWSHFSRGSAGASIMIEMATPMSPVMKCCFSLTTQRPAHTARHLTALTVGSWGLDKSLCSLNFGIWHVEWKSSRTTRLFQVWSARSSRSLPPATVQRCTQNITKQGEHHNQVVPFRNMVCTVCGSHGPRDNGMVNLAREQSGRAQPLAALLLRFDSAQKWGYRKTSKQTTLVELD